MSPPTYSFRQLIGARIASVILALAAGLPASADDWPQFFGLARDGKSAETAWNQDWDSMEPEVLWKAELGRGCASFAVADGRCFSTGNTDDRDSIFCFDALTGKTIWSHSYEQRLDPKYYKGGTSATPTVDGDRVYSVGKEGDLFCLDAATGKVRWHRNYQQDFGGRRQTWGWAASPLISGDLLVVDPGGEAAAVVALDKLTGEIKWQAGEDQHGYAAPVHFRNVAGDGVMVFGGNGLHAFAMADGAPLFSFPWKTKYDINASMPLALDGDLVFLSSGYGSGCSVIRIHAGNKKVDQVYKNHALSLQFQSGVRVDGHLYAVDGQTGRKAFLRCLHLKSGEVLWSEKFSGDLGTLIQVDKLFLIMKEVGELTLGRLAAEGYEELGSVQILKKPVWATPAFSNGLLYCRNNDGDAVCVDLRK